MLSSQLYCISEKRRYPLCNGNQIPEQLRLLWTNISLNLLWTSTSLNLLWTSGFLKFPSVSTVCLLCICKSQFSSRYLLFFLPSLYPAVSFLISPCKRKKFPRSLTRVSRNRATILLASLKRRMRMCFSCVACFLWASRWTSSRRFRHSAIGGVISSGGERESLTGVEKLMWAATCVQSGSVSCDVRALQYPVESS